LDHPASVNAREQTFLAELPLVERVIRSVCARRCLRGADAEDFRSVVMTRFVEDDYEVFAKFEGRSSLKTFLMVVVHRIYLDFQAQRFGRWRPSAESRRLGPTAERLECLIDRDGLTLSEACGVLSTDARVRESTQALEQLYRSLPHRVRARDRPTEDDTRRAEPASGALERGERQALADRTFTAIERSLLALPTQDRMLLRLHFGAGLTLAEIARHLGVDQKGLYGKRDKILKGLRSDLAREGIEAADALELLSGLDWEVACLTEETPLPEATPEQTAAEPGNSRPSSLVTDAGEGEGGA